jgi:putative serine protease PepD
MKYRKSMLCLSLLAGLFVQPANAQTGSFASLPDKDGHKEVVKKAGSTVEIIRTDGHLGGGVQIWPGLILTAAHLVAQEKTVTIMDDLGRAQVGTVEVGNTNQNIDIAFVGIDLPSDLQVSPVSCKLPPVGLKITMIGHPYGRTFVQMYGAVATSERKVGQWQSVVILTKNAFPGMSGGPVLNEDGAVVGLIVLAAGPVGDPAGPAGAVPGNVICANLPDTHSGASRAAFLN